MSMLVAIIIIAVIALLVVICEENSTRCLFVVLGALGFVCWLVVSDAGNTAIFALAAPAFVVWVGWAAFVARRRA